MNEAFWDDMNYFKNAYDEMISQVCQKFNINPAECNIILFLSKNKDDTATDIVKYTGYSKSNVSTAIRKLELSDYLETICLDSNRRTIHLKLKDKSKPVVSYYQRQKKKLEEDGETAHPAVVAHWRSIVNGNVPFGYTVKDE